MLTPRPMQKLPLARPKTSSVYRSGGARDVFAQAATLKGLDVVGIDVHIGSQLTELAPFEQAYGIVRDLVHTLRGDGHDIRRLDLGGGLGIPYERSNTAPPLPVEYCDMIKRTVW